MQSRLLWMCEFFTLDIQCQFVNVSSKRLKWLLQFIIYLVSDFRLNIGAKQSVVNVEDSFVWSFEALEVGSIFWFSKCW